MTGRHLDLDAEQCYVDNAYICLDRARQRAIGLTTVVEAGPGGQHQTRFEREALIEGALSRLSQLHIGDRSLVFGRLDIAGTGERFYIGRVGLWDDQQEPVVVDWRAPVSESFYRATIGEPLGLQRRRHFASRGRKLLGIEDELFDDSARAGGPESMTGRAALTAALEAPRSGQLGDAVATIQREQDTVIRSPMRGVLVVSGGSGHG